MNSSRRDFIRAATIAASAGARLYSADEQAGLGWYDRPMRWAQLTLVENDPGTFDPAFWLDYFRRTHSDAACLSAGGCIAYYPTKIPFHHRSRWLGDSDPFGELVAGCRKLGMNVIARTDPHATHPDVYQAHPDWIAVDAQGNKRKHWADPDFWVTCALGPYNFEFMTAVTKEIVTLYKVDGVFSNRWDGSGMCYCEHCRQNFKAFCGRDLPRTNNPQDPPRRDYILWREQRLFELWRLWDGEIRKINPNASFIANTGGGALSSLDMTTVGELSHILFADRQARRGLMPPWMNGKNGKEYRSTLGRKPIGGIFSVGVEEPYRWKDSVQNAEEIKVWVAEGIANGLRPWFTKFSGTLRDRRWLKPVEEIYNWHYQNERYLRNEESLARVGRVYSQQTARFYGGEQARAKVEDHTLGFYQALIEARIPFEMVHDKLLDAAHVDRFRTLILPNIAALSDKQCAQLREFVERGGRIVATHETSLYNEVGVRRAEFGLSQLFGTSFGGKLEGPMQNSYLTVEKDPGTGRFHPILKGLEDAERIINGVHRVVANPLAKPAYSPLTLVPSYPDLPMEEVFPRVPKTDIPEVFVHDFGRGRVVYFPWDIDRTFWEVLSTDHGKLLRNAVEWVTDEALPVTVTGPGLLDVTIWRQKQSMTVHLVNLTNPMMMKGPIREIIPVGPMRLSIRLPQSARVARVHTLVGRTDRPFRVTDGSIRLEVPTVGVHEVVALDLG
ncbi:MAG TPA: alpha-amylase family protein [Bryobacteraceae bacterium]|nr:alpha-amylase family protein [Bryobacteraceae bacterium]